MNTDMLCIVTRSNVINKCPHGITYVNNVHTEITQWCDFQRGHKGSHKFVFADDKFITWGDDSTEILFYQGLIITKYPGKVRYYDWPTTNTSKV